MGRIIIKTTPEGNFVRTNPAHSVIHEIVHIGIEENIVQKYNLSQKDKERLVDLICSIYLQDILPNYYQYSKPNTTLDPLITNEVIVDSLPVAIEKFIKKNSQETTSFS